MYNNMVGNNFVEYTPESKVILEKNIFNYNFFLEFKEKIIFLC